MLPLGIEILDLFRMGEEVMVRCQQAPFTQRSIELFLGVAAWLTQRLNGRLNRFVTVFDSVVMRRAGRGC